MESLNNLVKKIVNFTFSPTKDESIGTSKTKHEKLFESVSSVKPDEDRLFNDLVSITQKNDIPLIPANEAGSIEFISNLMNVNPSSAIEISYNKKGQVTDFKINYELSNDYQKGRVRTYGHNYHITYHANGSITAIKTEVLKKDGGQIMGSALSERYEFDKDGNLTYKNVDY